MEQIIREIEALTESSIGLVIVSLFSGIVLSVIVILYQHDVSGAVIRSLMRHNADSPQSAKTLRELGLWKNIFVRAALLGKGGTLRRIIAVAEETSRREEKADHGISRTDDADLSGGSVITCDMKVSDGADLSDGVQNIVGERNSGGTSADFKKSRKSGKRLSDVKQYVKMPLGSCHFYLPPEHREKAESLFGGKRQNPLIILVYLILLVLLGVGLIKLIPHIFQL